MAEFIKQAVDEKIHEVNQSKGRLILSCDAFDKFFTACEVNAEPSKQLLSLAAKVDERGFK